MTQKLVENLVVENNLKTILESLMRTQMKKNSVMVWQLENEDKRVIKNAYLKEIDAKAMSLILRSADGRALIFDKDLDLFIRCDDRGLLFKGEIQNLEADELEIVLPREARILENRINQRSEIRKDLDVKMVVEKDDIAGKARFDLILENINTNGVGSIFSVSKLKSFNLGDKVIIREIGRHKYSSPIQCEVVHLTSIQQKTDGLTSRLIKMGLKFTEVVPAESLREIIQAYSTKDSES